jgi:hypothetical protein
MTDDDSSKPFHVKAPDGTLGFGAGNQGGGAVCCAMVAPVTLSALQKENYSGA